VVVLESVFYGREVTVGGIGALSSRAIGNDVIIKEVGFFEDGGELGSDMGVNEGIKIMKKGDGSTVNGLRFWNEGASTLAGL